MLSEGLMCLVEIFISMHEIYRERERVCVFILGYIHSILYFINHISFMVGDIIHIYIYTLYFIGCYSMCVLGFLPLY